MMMTLITYPWYLYNNLLILWGGGVKVPAYYQYSWEVKDLPSGNDYRQQETRDGHLTTGLYQVLLPGGRHQVSFHKFIKMLGLSLFVLHFSCALCCSP